MPLTMDDRSDLQGIVASGFAHLDHAGYLFLRFEAEPAARTMLRGILPAVTTAAPWEVRAGVKRRPDSTLSVGLTYTGLAALGLPEDALATFPTEFAVGMPARAIPLGDSGDSAPERWELGGPANPPVHAMLGVYARTGEDLDGRVDDLRKAIAKTRGGVVEVALEQGCRQADSREPYGFAADGRSQPLIEGLRGRDRSGNPVVRTGEFVLGHVNEMGFYPDTPAVRGARGDLPALPEGAQPECGDLGRNGTYLAYRKLRQDVAGFWRYVQRWAEAAGGGEDLATRMAWLASRLMGRWPASGSPVVLSPDVDDPNLVEDNRFLYRALDYEGYRCPIGAHIRRANPRDSLIRVDDTGEESIATSQQHRVLRRGVPYGEPLFPAEVVAGGGAPIDLADDGHPRGLHFLALCADLKRQFEFVQQSWLNLPTFNGLYDSTDVIVGDSDGTATMVLQARPLRRQLTSVPRFTSVTGGAYLFLPGLTALRWLTRPA